MFSQTPTDDIIENKNILNLQLYEGEDLRGYYTPQLNEIINGKYRVIGICGKGIFSNVVKVIDITTEKTYAIKILRSIDVMLLSGEKERSLLKKFRELDKQGTTLNILNKFQLTLLFIITIY
jgi:hypothetical protein